MSKLEQVFLQLSKLQFRNKKGTTALELSKIMNLDRANVSRYLNILYKDGRVDKTDSRPVIYSISHIKEKKKNNEKITFNNIIGSRLSLKLAIEQAKAAVLYPPHGLHTLILGETGVGKSMFAEQMYMFAKESKVINEDAPFVRFNCADYADNPQLVISQIFGVKRGAYTGAENDKKGLLEQANGGIFFLDEVHRLSPQAQEMLFTYIDKGSFRRLGDTESIINVDAQIIVATTEEPKSFMLSTFIRRIPVTITLPPLRERTIEERYYLLDEFIKIESKRVNKSIYFNKNALISFLLYDCPNNIGQLKSDIQLACAKAFLNYRSDNKSFILVDQVDLQNVVKRGIMQLQYHREDVNKLLNNVGDVLKFYYKDEEEVQCDENRGKSEYFYDIIDSRFIELRKKGLSEKEISDILNIDIDEYFKNYIRDLPEAYRKDEIVKVVDVSVVNIVEEIIAIATNKLNKKYKEKVYFGLALHLQSSLERIRQGNKIYNPKLNIIRVQYSEEFMVAMECAKLIDEKFNVQLPLDEIGYLTMFIATDDSNRNETKKNRVAVAVIMHGYSTATSMAEVANSLIGEEFVIALDMPLTMKAEDMYNIVKNKVKEIGNNNGVLLLVDMGSLTNFGDMIEEETGIRVKTVDMVSTLLVIEAGRRALNCRDLTEIYNSCIDISRPYIKREKIIKRNWENIIITACFTGQGSAEKLKEILIEKLNESVNLKIIPLNIVDRHDFKKRVEALNNKYNILSIVGTVNINIDNIPFIDAADILAGNAVELLNLSIHNEEDFLKIVKAMELQISDIDSRELISLIRESISDIEEMMKIIIPHEVQVGMVIHICLLVQRILNDALGTHFNKLSKYRELYNKEFIIIKQSLRKLELHYNITISDDDLAFIVRIVIENGFSV